MVFINYPVCKQTELEDDLLTFIIPEGPDKELGSSLPPRAVCRPSPQHQFPPLHSYENNT